MSTFMVFNPGLDNEVSIFYPRVLVSVCGIELQFIITPTFQTIGLVSVRVIITESDPYHRLLSRSSTRRHSGMSRWTPQTRPNARRLLIRRIRHRIKQRSVMTSFQVFSIINSLYHFYSGVSQRRRPSDRQSVDLSFSQWKQQNQSMCSDNRLSVCFRQSYNCLKVNKKNFIEKQGKNVNV